MRLGAGSGEIGAMTLRVFFQKGLKTWKGLPLKLQISQGSASRAELNERTSSPDSRNRVLID